MEAWFTNRFCRIGVMKYHPHKGLCTFFWNAKLDERFVRQRISELAEKVVDFKLGTNVAGREFEKVAIARFVEYLIARGRKIVLNQGFPGRYSLRCMEIQL